MGDCLKLYGPPPGLRVEIFELGTRQVPQCPRQAGDRIYEIKLVLKHRLAI
jgi:hypothetical protein